MSRLSDLGQNVKKLTFDSDELTGGNPFDAMSEFSQGLYKYSKASNETNNCKRPYLRLNAWRLGRVAAAHFAYSEMRVDGRHDIDPTLQDHALLRIVKKGQVIARCGQNETVMVPGQIYILPPNNVLRPIHEGVSVGMRLPRDDIELSASKNAGILAFNTQSPIGAVVLSAINSLFESLSSISEKEAQLAGAMVCNLIRALANTAPVDDDTHWNWQDTRQYAMRAYVMDNLKDTEIGTAKLMSKFGASRATLYRAFEDVGGVASFVRDQRLEAINRELRASQQSYGCVSRIARRYGYVDQSLFNKSFKRRFELKPSEVVGLDNRGDTKSKVVMAAPGCDLPKLASFWSAA